MADDSQRGAELAPYERTTLAATFLGAVDRFGAQPALRHRDGEAAGGWRDTSYEEAADAVGRIAGWLLGRGTAPGDRIAILSENRPEWALADYAALCIGAVTVPVYPTLPADQVAHILDDAQAGGVIVSNASQLDKVSAWAARAGAWVVVMEDDDVMDDDGVMDDERVGGDDGARGVERGGGSVTRTHAPWPELLAGQPEPSLRERAARLQPGDLATLVYSSGTTGAPKGVMLTHGNFAYMVAATAQHGSVPAGAGDVCLSMLPLSHVFERAACYFFWDSGVTIAYAQSLATLADDLAEVRPHVMVSVPRLFDRLHDRVVQSPGVKGRLGRWAAAVARRGTPRGLAGRVRFALADRVVYATLRRRTGGRLRGFISGGAPLARDVGAFFFAAGMPIYEGYGLTETSPVLCANRPGQVKLGTVGVPYPGVELRIGAEGEIQARGPGIMHGYWRAPEATAAVLDGEGWLRTGDVGEFDDVGFLRITDRLKDLIVTTGGKNIAPQPVEQAVLRSPYVAQAIMIGDRRPFPVLLVVPDWDGLAGWARQNGLDLTDRDAAVRDPRLLQLIEQDAAALLQSFARHETPRRFGLLPTEFTVESGLLTPTLKPKRRAIEQVFRPVIDDLYLPGSLDSSTRTETAP
jgi:long-chain acyl-CoA synthetase